MAPIHLSPARGRRATVLRGPAPLATRLASVAVVFVLSVPACAAPAQSAPAPTSAVPTASTGTAFPLTVTDDEGTAVTLASEPRTIVSLTPATTETLFALGVGDRVKGKGEDLFLFPPAAGDIPDVTNGGRVDTEKIVGLRPDVVFAGGNSFTPPESIAKLRQLGLKVIVLYAPSVDVVHHDIGVIGDAVGRSAEAASIDARVKGGFAAVTDAVKVEPKPRVYYELDATGGYYAPADSSFLAEMIELAGGDPITTGSADKFDISQERLITADPQLILLADAPFGVTVDQVKARPGWNVMTAVKEGDIRPIDDQTVTRPGPRLFKGLELLAKTIHPDASVPSASPIPPVP